MIINHQYKITYKALRTQPENIFKRHNDIVSLYTYRPKILPFLQDVYVKLQNADTKRQAVIIVNTLDDNSCLLSLQFQEYNGVLFVTANYRSESEVYGRPVDEDMINYVATLLLDKYEKRRIKKVDITVNVGNYHHEKLKD